MVAYVSTRGQAPEQSFLQILLTGLAPDGGLYIPKKDPWFPKRTLEKMVGMNYQELALSVLSCFADDIPTRNLEALIGRTYTAEAFSHGRPDSDSRLITPLRKLEGDLYLLELSNGPTLAFKDVAMQLLGNLFEYALGQEKREINILGATSGDTGSAAEYAMRGKNNVRVFMLSPAHGMTPFQQAQMYSLEDPNIFNIAIRGVFDDCQRIVKAVSSDPYFKERYHIGAVNSINWARIAAQVVYFFEGYFAAVRDSVMQVGYPVDFSVPSGNLGDVCAGHIARVIGLPIGRIIVATNENNVLDEFFRTGVYRPRPSADVTHTECPSMDIARASNLERLYAHFLARDSNAMQICWNSLDSGAVDGLNFWHGTDIMRSQFGLVSGSSTRDDRIEMIRRIWTKNGVMIDPHTAAGLVVGQGYRQAGVPLVCLETALPAKFEGVIREALVRNPDRPANLAGIETRRQWVVTMDPNVDDVKRYIAANCS